MNKYIEIFNELNQRDNIYILSHINPDGDCIGSALAIFNYLKTIDKNVKMPKADNIPDDFDFLPGIEEIKPLEKIDDNYTIITVDSAGLNRLGKNVDLIENADLVINIDHHISNDYFADINLVLDDASSTGEVIYRLFKANDIILNYDIAMALYTAISSDTGSFMYSNTSQRTHEIIADLYNYNIDTDMININLYQSNKLQKAKLFSEIILNLELFFKDKLAIAKIDYDLVNKYGLQMDDTEGLVETIRNIKEVELAIILKERKDNKTRVSARSKGEVDVSKLCSIFGGGGHKRAAGCSIDSNLDMAAELLIKEIGKL